MAMDASSSTRALLTPSEVAAMFRVNQTVTRWARAGKISAIGPSAATGVSASRRSAGSWSKSRKARALSSATFCNDPGAGPESFAECGSVWPGTASIRRPTLFRRGDSA
jgi:hypothetical protein